jgi:CRISPR/Cas system endoribonuclease Cas6 (RAMP superfamily)
MESFELILSFDEPLPRGKEWGRALHGVFFELLNGKQAPPGNWLHSLPPPKPYTLRPQLLSDVQVKLKVVVLADKVGKALAEEFPQKVGSTVQMDGQRASLACAMASRESSYEEILQRAEATEYFLLTFKKTAFKRGDHNYALPDPGLIFESLYCRWRHFSPLKLEEGLSIVWERGQVTVCGSRNLRILPVQLGKEEILCFSGTMLFRIMTKELSIRRQVHSLARYSTIAGVGAKTTMGLGVVTQYMPLVRDEARTFIRRVATL